MVVLDTPERRKAYFSRHKTEHPFPLDGTDWARLVEMRLDRVYHEKDCLCDSCHNLLTKLHSEHSPLLLESAGVRRALHHWFLTETPMDTQALLERIAQKPAYEVVKTLPPVTPGGDVLSTVERDWLSQRNKAWAAGASKHWLSEASEAFEAIPSLPLQARIESAKEHQADDETKEVAGKTSSVSADTARVS